MLQQQLRQKWPRLSQCPHNCHTRWRNGESSHRSAQDWIHGGAQRVVIYNPIFLAARVVRCVRHLSKPQESALPRVRKADLPLDILTFLVGDRLICCCDLCQAVQQLDT